MRIIDLTAEHKDLFCLCLEDWSDEAKEGVARRRAWMERFEPLGLRAKLALDGDDSVGGMIQYLPIEHSFADGSGLYVILCVWVHGHDQGRGNFQKQGMGKALLAAAEEDARTLGAKGMAAWGIWLPFWMRASWFKKHGYRKADRQGLALLLWKPFADDAAPPRWFPKTKKKPELTPGKVTVTAFCSGWCMAMNLSAERARRVADEFGDRVAYRELDGADRATLAEWGMADDVFVDHRKITTGPPLTCDKIRKIISKRVRKL